MPSSATIPTDYLRLEVDNDPTTAKPRPMAQDLHASDEPKNARLGAPMTNNVSRDELQAELRALRSESDAKFERIVGEVRVANAELRGAIQDARTETTGDINTFKSEIAGKLDVLAAKSAGKWTIWGAAGATIGTLAAIVIGTLVVLLQVAQTGYDTGASQSNEIRADVEKLDARIDAIKASQGRPQLKMQQSPE